jgi:hypothetical protein
MVNNTNRTRTWRYVAALVAQETDPAKLAALTEELLRTMEEEKRQADARLAESSAKIKAA